MFEHTDTRWAPWTVIDGNDKKSARIAALTSVADVLGDALPADPPPVRLELARLAQKPSRTRGETSLSPKERGLTLSPTHPSG